uniref:Uncharacterized protein n=1 Tax=Timema genevievae TaxID=629358 RepID=A0A7R9PJ68_TIMGE|nr:unnamed protein product [Timema genevievae]
MELVIGAEATHLHFTCLIGHVSEQSFSSLPDTRIRAWNLFQLRTESGPILQTQDRDLKEYMYMLKQAKSSSPHELRTDRRHTDRFTLNMNQQGRRHSRRKQGTQRAHLRGGNLEGGFSELPGRKGGLASYRGEPAGREAMLGRQGEKRKKYTRTLNGSLFHQVGGCPARSCTTVSTNINTSTERGERQRSGETGGGSGNCWTFVEPSGPWFSNLHGGASFTIGQSGLTYIQSVGWRVGEWMLAACGLSYLHLARTRRYNTTPFRGGELKGERQGGAIPAVRSRVQS